MKAAVLSFLALAIVFPLSAGTSGEFRGTIVDGPDRSNAWVYVLGKNHSVRRVFVSGAQIQYGSDVPQSQRERPAPKVLPVGTQVRITAEQDAAGEWHATQIEILEPEGPAEKKTSSPPTSKG